jgi:hypothetical protein
MICRTIDMKSHFKEMPLVCGLAHTSLRKHGNVSAAEDFRARLQGADETIYFGFIGVFLGGERQ